jgi:hypothetical protein
MLDMRHFIVDRRFGGERRRMYNLDYFLKGGVERRSWKERRKKDERREGWMRISKWSSVSPQLSARTTSLSYI